MFCSGWEGRQGPDELQQPEGEEVPGGRSNPTDPNSPCLGILKMVGGREFQDRSLPIELMYVRDEQFKAILGSLKPCLK